MAGVIVAGMKLSCDAIREILAVDGPLTSIELAGYFPGAHSRQTSRIISNLRNYPKPQVYIHHWTRDLLGGRVYLRAAYALGNRPDAAKPAVLDRKTINARYWQRRKLRAGEGVPNSIWQFAQQQQA